MLVRETQLQEGFSFLFSQCRMISATLLLLLLVREQIVSRIRERIWGNNMQDKELVSHLVKLLAPTLSEKVFQKSDGGEVTRLR